MPESPVKTARLQVMENLMPIDILLVEDNPADIELTRIAFKEARVANVLHVAEDGQEALDYVFKRPPYENSKTPDIILLDINLPQLNGIQVLESLKTDAKYRTIPIIMLTSSSAERDVLSSYSHHANSYITKPVSFDKFLDVARQIEEFWLTVVKLPSNTTD